MKVLFCTDGISPFSVVSMQRHSRLLIEALSEYSSLEVHVVHPHEGAAIFPSRPNVIEHIVTTKPGLRPYLVDRFQYSKEVLSIALDHPDSVIYSQGLSIWAGIDQLKDRLIVNPHGLEPYQAIGLSNRLSSIPFRAVFNHIMGKAGHIVALGGRLTDILSKRFGSEKVVVLPNATNLPVPYKPKAFGLPLRCLFVGRFAFNKGIDVLMRAVRMLNQQGYGDSIVFDLVGSGPLYDEYCEKYSFRNLNFHGRVIDAELEGHLENSSILILPTLFEGMPTVVLEAMSYGTPIIVTDVGATCELVDSSNGFIIEKRNPISLVNAILDFNRLTPDEKQNLAARSRTKVAERFTWNNVAEEHINIFGQIYDRI